MEKKLEKIAQPTMAEVKRRIAGLDSDSAKKIVCALVGHSRIITQCFGYVYCARCDAQIGDALGGVFSRGYECAIVGHNCKVCRASYKKMDWRDKFLSPDPFVKEPEAVTK